MHPKRPFLFQLAGILLLAAILVACGDSASTTTTGSNDDAATTAESSSADSADSADTEGTPDVKITSSSFSETPELRECMDAAGWRDHSTPEGGIKAWDHPDGVQVVISTGADTVDQIAVEIGDESGPADINEDVVYAGAKPLTDAALKCLDQNTQ